MSETPLLGLPVLEANQAQKHVTHNEALLILDAAIHLAVESRSLTAPPATPADGDRYLVAAGATGAWAGHDGKLAIRQSGGWTFASAREGWRLWISDESAFFVFDGTVWRDLQAIAELENMTRLGINATADATNRLSVSSDSVLLNHAGSDLRLKLNKQASSNTASLLYQTGFSGRAEMGLSGDDDFHVKVSTDGSTWQEAIVVDRATGAVSMPNTGSTLPNGDKGDVAVSSGVWHFERTNGTPGNGTSDDAPYLTDMLAAGKTVILSDRKSYLLKTPVVFSVAGTGIVAPMGATLTMSMAAGAFDNDVFGDRYSITTAGGKKYAVGLSATGIDGIFVHGVIVRPSAWTDLRYLKAMAFSECDDLDIAEFEGTLFSRTRGVITLNDCDRARIIKPFIHDCWSNSLTVDGASPAGSAQITAIEVDGDCTQGSKHGQIVAGRFHNITVGDALRNARGYQTDGVNLQGTNGTVTNKPTTGFEILDCQFNNLGEAVDIFGNDNLVGNCQFRRCFGAGLKFVHGASRNLVDGGHMREMGYTGVLMGGSTAVDVNADGNEIRNLKIHGWQTAGDWDNADGSKSYDAAAYGGAAAWSGTTNAGIRIDNPTGATSVLTNVRLSNLTLDGGGTGKYGIYCESGGVGSATHVARNCDIANTSLGTILDGAARITVQDFTGLAKASGDVLADAAGDTRLLARHDMVSGAWNGSFELGDLNYTKETSGGIGWTIENDPANARSGNFVAKNANVASSNLALYASNRKRVRAGETVYAEAWIKSDAGAVFTTCRVRVRWLDKDGATLSHSDGTNYNSVQLTYVLSQVSGTAPASAAYYVEVVQVSGKSAGTIWADDLFSFRKRDAAALLASGTVTTTQLGGDITSAGKAIIAAADAAAQTALLNTATTSLKGLMSSTDKTKLDAVTGTNTGDETAAGVLAKLITVDGAGSGLDADLLDGLSSAAFAAAVHTHLAADISDSTAAGRSLLTAADAAAQRTALGLGTAATQNTGTSGANVPLLNGANTFQNNTAITAGTASAPLAVTNSSTGRGVDITTTTAGASRTGLHLQNNGTTANTEVLVDLNPTNQVAATRSAQVAATNDGANNTSLDLRTADAAVPATRFRIGSKGQFGIGGATYGTSGHVFVSGGASAAPQWRALIATDISDSTAAGRSMLTAADAAAQTALLNSFTSALKGLVPSSGGGTTNFLRADGSWAVPIAGTAAQFNQSVANQGAGFAADTYLTGSNITVPSGSLKAGSRYRLVFDVTKTAAGTATPTVIVRFGTGGSTADTALATLTFLAQTAAADDGRFTVEVTFRTVGSGTSAVIQAVGTLTHRLQITGLANLSSPTVRATSAGFDSTVASSIIGVSVNGGASAAWTVQLVQATLENLN